MNAERERIEQLITAIENILEKTLKECEFVGDEIIKFKGDNLHVKNITDMHSFGDTKKNLSCSTEHLTSTLERLVKIKNSF